MKKLFILASAALVLAACNNDVKIDENVALEGSNAQKEIALSSYAQRPKRVKANAPISGAEYPDNQVMYVAAYAMPISSSWTAGGYFDETPFNGTNETSWKGTPSRYWPLSDARVSFLAVTGIVDEDDIAFTAPDYAGEATVTYDDACFAAQGDLMYAGKQESVTKAGNVLTYPDDVDMEFKHALAWLHFAVRIPNAATYTTAIDITSIVVNGAYKTGTYMITNTGYDADGDPTPTGAWSAWSAAAPATVPGSEYTAALPNDGSYANCGDVLLVPKVSPTTSFTSFTINYTIDGKAYSFEYTPASLVLAQATKYIFNITFTLTEIEIDPVVVGWTDGGSTSIEVPTPEP